MRGQQPDLPQEPALAPASLASGAHCIETVPRRWPEACRVGQAMAAPRAGRRPRLLRAPCGLRRGCVVYKQRCCASDLAQ